MSDTERSISEKTRVSVAVIVAVIAPVLWFFASDHNAIAALSKDQDEVRGDVKEIKRMVEDIRVQLARRSNDQLPPPDRPHR